MPLLIGAGIAGGAAIGAGGSIWSSLIQGNAAKEAAGTQSDAYFQARQGLQSAQGTALAYLDPYRQYGLNAGSSLQGLLYSPEQVSAQIEDQRAQLQGEVNRLKATLPVWEQFPIFTGKNASERRAAAFTEQYNTAQTQLKAAQSKLDTFNQQAGQLQARAQQSGPKIQESPWYQFQAQLLGRDMDRYFASRGLTGSGFEAEERRKGLLQLGAQETDKQYARLTGLYNTGANAASQGANILTGTASNVANTLVGQGQAEAQGILGAGQAQAGLISGVTNAITGGIAQGLNMNLFQNMISTLKNNNQPYRAQKDPVMGTGYATNGGDV